jgi:solute carrier family 25 aspartate/glutamate transporter 12/13
LHRHIRYLDTESFVNAIAPKGDLTRIGRSQFAILFRIADTSRRGLVSWEDFTVFETLLKRPDADYWMAFQYFDVCVLPPCLSRMFSDLPV